MSDKMRRNDPGGDVDGVDLDDLIDIKDGVYHRRERTSLNERRKRFTCFAGWGPHDPGDVENGPRIEWACIEEIDVDAVDETDARVICDLVLIRDYEPDGHIFHVEERIPGTMYF